MGCGKGQRKKEKEAGEQNEQGKLMLTAGIGSALARRPPPATSPRRRLITPRPPPPFPSRSLHTPVP